MKAKELIEKLGKFDKEKEVWAEGDYGLFAVTNVIEEEGDIMLINYAD